MTETPSEPVDGHPAPEPQDAADAEPSSDVSALRREAASYRRRLRAVEAERDALVAQVDARDRADVERLASDKLADPSDLWQGGVVELTALRGDDGALEPERIAAAVDAVVAARPHWAKPAKAPSFDGGAGVTPAPAGPSMPFGEALKGR